MDWISFFGKEFLINARKGVEYRCPFCGTVRDNCRVGRRVKIKCCRCGRIFVSKKPVSWYDKIEKPIRELVRFLRENGYNTYNSCGHKMYVDIEGMFNRNKDVEELAYLLNRYGYNSWSITYKICCSNGVHKDSLRLEIVNKEMEERMMNEWEERVKREGLNGHD